MESKRPGASRSLQTLEGFIYAFEAEQERWLDGQKAFASEAAPILALPVRSYSVATQNPVGTVRPSAWLSDCHRREFEDVEGRRTKPEDPAIPRSCLLIDEAEETVLRHRLLRSGMAVLLEEDQVAKLADDRILLAGLFCVPRKTDYDRLVVDHRPASHGDRRIGWSTLPLGPQLCQIVTGPGEVVRGSGDDRRIYFYCLENAKETLPYNAFGRRVEGGEDWAEYGAEQGKVYRALFE
jgi:hypothetical protein